MKRVGSFGNDPHYRLPWCWPSSRRRLNLQAFDYTSVLQMLADYFVHILLVHVRIPNLFRIHDDDRTLLAAIQAAGHVDARLAFTRQTQCFHFAFRILAHFGGAMIVAAGLALFALIAAEKDVMLVIAHEKAG